MSAKTKRPRRGISWGVTLFLLILIAVVLWWRGHDFYPLSLNDRVDHPEFRELRSSGHIGYGYGVAGTLLIFANLLYLARRKLAKRNLGSLKTWLDLHVFTGLAGAMFVSFHATFQARSTMSKVTSLSLVIVVVTGLVGRFLFALIPRAGKRDLDQAIGELDELVPGIGEQIKTVLDHYKVAVQANSLLGALAAIPASRRAIRTRREAICLIVDNADIGGANPKKVRRARKRVLKQDKRAVRAVSVAALLRTWRALHRLCAILMLLTVVFHIAVAWYYGYRWIWST